MCINISVRATIRVRTENNDEGNGQRGDKEWGWADEWDSYRNRKKKTNERWEEREMQRSWSQTSSMVR